MHFVYHFGYKITINIVAFLCSLYPKICSNSTIVFLQNIGRTRIIEAWVPFARFAISPPFIYFEGANDGICRMLYSGRMRWFRLPSRWHTLPPNLHDFAEFLCRMRRFRAGAIPVADRIRPGIAGVIRAAAECLSDVPPGG